MANNRELDKFYEIIPWKYSSTKIDNDALELLKLKVEDETTLSHRISARKGWFSRAMERIAKDEEYHKKFGITGKQSHNRYKETLQFLEERFSMLTNGYRRYLQLFPMQQDRMMEAFQTHVDTYWNCRDIMDRLLDSTDTETVNNTKLLTNNTREIVPKVTQSLAPNQLTEVATPQIFVDWCERLQVYFGANSILNRPFSEQMQYARSFMSSQLWFLIRDKITPDMPVFLAKTDATYIDQELNCLIDILEREFLRIHPTIIRKLAVFAKRQRSEQSSLSFLSELKRDALSANLYELREETILCILLINGLSNDSLRRELLDAIDIEDELSISDLEHEIRKWEANRRTNTYVQGKSNEIFKLSSYKKQKNQAKRNKAAAIICRSCGRSGHVAANCYSTQTGNRNRGRNRNKNRPSYRPQQRGRSSSRRPNNYQRKQYRSQSRSRNVSYGKKPQYRKSNILRALTQSNDTEDENEADENGKHVNYIRALKNINSHTFIDGFPTSLPTPRIPVRITPLGPNDTRGETFNHDVVPDTGATRTVCSLYLSDKWKLWITSAEMESLTDASGHSLRLTGCSSVDITYGNTSLKVYVLITPDVADDEFFLSWHDLLNLKILSLDLNSGPQNTSYLRQLQSTTVNNVNQFRIENDSIEKILEDFKDVVSDKMPTKPIKGYQMRIFLDKSKPFPKMPYIAGRNRPAALEDMAANDIKRMLREDIIMRADKPSEFLHLGFHSLKPDGSLRFLVDFSTGINTCIKRQIHPFIPGNQLLQKIRPTSRAFAVFDCLHGYYQLELHESARPYSCFVVNEGRFFFKRCPMGMSQSADSFIEATNQILGDLDLLKLIDDIALQAEDFPTLYVKIRQMLTRCREFSIGLSRKKVQCGDSIRFSGHIVSAKGILMDPDKLRALRDFSRPKDKTDTKSFLGLLGTFSTFYCEIAELRQPLNELLKKDVKFHWNDILEKAFITCKTKLLHNRRILAPFDPKLDTYCYTDASRIGMAVAIIQYRSPNMTDTSLIMCASRSLVKAEVSYGCTDLEMTASTWGICKASYWLRGLYHFFLMTDHRCLKNIFEKPLSSIATPRQLRLRQKLIGYNFTTVFIRGSSNCLADALSRAPTEAPSEDDILEANQCDATANICNRLRADINVINPMLTEMVKFAKEDENYQEVKKLIQNGLKQEEIRQLRPEHPAKILAKDWNRISVLGDLLVFDGTRLIVPRKQRPFILNLLHSSCHGGITKVKTAAKELYYFPNMNNMISQMISACDICVTNRPTVRHKTFVPVKSHYPLERLAADPFMYEGKNYLASKCCFTGWLFCHKLKNLTSSEVISKLESIFLVFGKCYIFQSDFGPCFRSAEFQDWLKDNHIIHETSSSYHGSSNGNIECSVRILKAIMAKNGSNWPKFEKALQEFNNLPRADSYSPSFMMFGRRQKTSLPALESAFDLKDPVSHAMSHKTQNNKSRKSERESIRKMSTVPIKCDFRDSGKRACNTRRNVQFSKLLKLGTNHSLGPNAQNFCTNISTTRAMNPSSSTFKHEKVNSSYFDTCSNPVLRGDIFFSTFSDSTFDHKSFTDRLLCATENEGQQQQQLPSSSSNFAGPHNFPKSARHIPCRTLQTPNETLPIPIAPQNNSFVVLNTGRPSSEIKTLCGNQNCTDSDCKLDVQVSSTTQGPSQNFQYDGQKIKILRDNQERRTPAYPNAVFTFKNPPSATIVHETQQSGRIPVSSMAPLSSLQKFSSGFVQKISLKPDAPPNKTAEEMMSAAGASGASPKNLDPKLSPKKRILARENRSLLKTSKNSIKKSRPLTKANRLYRLVNKIAYHPYRPLRFHRIPNFAELRKHISDKRITALAKCYKDEGHSCPRTFFNGENVAVKNHRTKKYDSRAKIWEEASHHRTAPINKSYLIHYPENPGLFSVRSHVDLIPIMELEKFSKNENFLFFMDDKHSHQTTEEEAEINDRIYFDGNEIAHCFDSMEHDLDCFEHGGRAPVHQNLSEEVTDPRDMYAFASGVASEIRQRYPDVIFDYATRGRSYQQRIARASALTNFK